MSSFQSYVTLINNSADTLTFDPGASSGVHDSNWPHQIPPKTTLQIQQGYNFQIKFNAVYQNLASASPQKPTVEFYLYGDAVQNFSCELKQIPSNPPPYPTSYAKTVGAGSASYTVG